MSRWRRRGRSGVGRGAGEASRAKFADRLRRQARRPLAWLVLASVLLVAVPALLWLTSPDGSEYAEAWPERTAYMELRVRQAREEGRELAIRYRPVPLGSVPEPVRRAVRVSEDAAFYQHGGVDWHEVQAAVRKAWREEEAPRGASTLTMQLARNLYLSPERSPWRKLREVLIAVKMEGALEKRRIFELYLSVIELGPGVFGVEAASRHYWGVSVAALGPARAAELAATIPSPLRDNPSTASRRFVWRSSLVARRAFRDTASVDSAVAGLGSGRYPPEEAFGGDTGGAGLPHVDTVARPGSDTAVADTAGPPEVEPPAPAETVPPADTTPADTTPAGTQPVELEPAATDTLGGPAQPSDTAADSREAAGRKKGSHFSRGEASVSRLTTTSRVIDATTPGMTM